jgi:pimeloyl-ACP methyl ester carboxylesterase
MPVIRINAKADIAILHNSPRSVKTELDRIETGNGPVIIMIHGYKFSPGHARHCPHRHILSLDPEHGPYCPPSWPHHLGFGTGRADEGIAVAFAWCARGALHSARRTALDAGHALADVISYLHDRLPQRPIHIIAHSMGTEVAFEALHHLPTGAVQRIISLTGASYQSRAAAALGTAAGRTAELINITSRENDPFDFLFERLIRSSTYGDRAIGQGLCLPNSVTLQLDCVGTLQHLNRFGVAIGHSDRRICHWSAYTRPGVLRLYHDLLRRADTLPLSALRRGLPSTPAPRWSRLFARPGLRTPLPFVQNAS